MNVGSISLTITTDKKYIYKPQNQYEWKNINFYSYPLQQFISNLNNLFHTWPFLNSMLWHVWIHLCSQPQVQKPNSQHSYGIDYSISTRMPVQGIER